jgi:hypothetical protein
MLEQLPGADRTDMIDHVQGDERFAWVHGGKSLQTWL